MMNKRVEYRGGKKQQDRMIQDKLRGLKRALNYSYQAGTCVMPNGKEFRMLMNPNKLKPDYDYKVISIPFEDICLNEPMVGKHTEGIEPTGMEPGIVFQWKENNSYWLCWSRHYEEYAYFRGDCYCCEDNIADVNGNKYHVYFKGPDQQTIDWHTKAHDYWNKLNYTKIMWITKNEETLEYFHRFTECVINDQKWQVQVVNPDYGDGIIKVWVKEAYENKAADAAAAEKAELEPIEAEELIPYEEYEFTLPYVEGVAANLTNYSNAKIKPSIIDIIKQQDNTVKIKIIVLANKAGEFDLFYGDEYRHFIIKSL